MTTNPHNAHIVGRGPIHVIVLSGWFGHARGWQQFEHFIDQELFTFAFLDQRGYGMMLDSPGPYSLKQIADDALELADTLKWSEFVLMGHSMGGCGIQQILSQQPQRVQAMIAIAPVSARGVAFSDDERDFFLSAKSQLDTRQAIINITTGERHAQAWLEKLVKQSQQHNNPDAIEAYFNAWSGCNIVAAVKNNPVPVLVVVGAHDPAQGEAQVRDTWLQYYPNTTLKIITNAGHYPMDETPQELAIIINDYASHL